MAFLSRLELQKKNIQRGEFKVEKIYLNKTNVDFRQLAEPHIKEVECINLTNLDSMHIRQQLNLIIDQFYKSKIKSYKITDDFRNFLAKYKADRFIFIDILALHADFHISKIPRLFWFTKCFIIKRSGEVEYYSFCENKGDAGATECKGRKCHYHYYLPDIRNKFPRLRRNLRKYIRNVNHGKG
jgi:hypothetical protein